MERHFGIWLKKVREKLRLNQIDLAERLGLRSYQAIYRMEERKDRSMRGQTLESLLSLLGYECEEDLDRDWQAGKMPDLDRVRKRIRHAKELNGESRIVPPPTVERIRRFADSAGMTPDEWLSRLIFWLDQQPETWQEYVRGAITATRSSGERAEISNRGRVSVDPSSIERREEVVFHQQETHRQK